MGKNAGFSLFFSFLAVGTSFQQFEVVRFF